METSEKKQQATAAINVLTEMHPGGGGYQGLSTEISKIVYRPSDVTVSLAKHVRIRNRFLLHP